MVRSKVMSIRLPQGAYEMLEARALEMSIPAAVLARSYVISAIGYQPPAPPKPYLQAVREEVDRKLDEFRDQLDDDDGRQ